MQRIQAAAQDISKKLRLPLGLMQVLGVLALALFGAIGAWLGESATVWRCCMHQLASCEMISGGTACSTSCVPSAAHVVHLCASFVTVSRI